MIRRELKGAFVSIGKESCLLFAALSVVNASNYLFHMAVSRTLGPGNYGELGSVLAVLTVLSVPLTAIQTTIARKVAVAKRDRKMEAWQPIFDRILLPTLALFLVLALLSPLLGGLIRVDSGWTSLWVAAYIVPAVLASILRGALQGRMSFGRLALASLLPVVLRLTVGVAAVEVGLGVSGAVAASVLAEIIGVVFALWLLAYRPAPAISSDLLGSFLREVAPVGLGLGAMWFLIELDLVLARHFLSDRQAGEYAAAGLLARAVLFVPGAVSLIALPHFSQHGGRGNEAYRWLVSSCALVLGLGVVTSLILVFAGDAVVDVTFGQQFARAGALLPIMSLAMLGFSIVNLLIYFHIAARSRTFHLLWIAAIVEVAAISSVHASGTEIATVVLVFAWMIAACGFVTSRSLALTIPGADLPGDLQVFHEGPRDVSSPELSIIVPSYNSGPQLVRTVYSLAATLESIGKTYEVIVVSDGSTDGSEKGLGQELRNVHVVHYRGRHGKGVALRVGMSRARGGYVAFIDADGELDVTELRGFCVVMDLYNPDLVIGSKRHPLSQVEYPWSRRMLSWIYHRLVRVLFGLNVRDTQTGMKLVRRDVLDAVLARLLEKRFAFDLEFLVVARRLGYTRVFEAPIRLSYRFNSTVAPRDALRILVDTAAIYYRRYLVHFYDHPHPDMNKQGDRKDHVTLPADPELAAGHKIPS